MIIKKLKQTKKKNNHQKIKILKKKIINKYNKFKSS